MNKFEVPVHELTRKPGHTTEVELDIELESAMGQGVASVPVGAIVGVNLRLESIHEGIFTTGEVSTTASSLCSRCLEPLELEVEVDFQELFAYSSSSDDELLVKNDQIDLEQVVIDSVISSLPFQPLCSPNCSGLCPECGKKLIEDPNHEHLRPVDSRFEALKDLLGKEE